MRSDFILAMNQLCAERRLSTDVVLQAVEAALVSAYKRHFGPATNVEVRLEPSTGEARVFAVKEVVHVVHDPKIEILLAEARNVDPNVEIGQTVLIESTPRDFGRIAAQTAKQVILQRIREAERDALYDSFADSAGEIRHGTIQSIDYNTKDAVVNLDGAEAILPAREQVSTESYRRNARLRAYVLEVRKGNRGPQITLSRRTPLLLRRLMELEVPEIHNGSVEIKAIAREAGSRSKVAVHATQEGVDPVGSCVGVRGGRIQNVVTELGGEKIDVVQWDPEMSIYIGHALSPAKVMNVILDDNPEVGKTATVIVPDRQLSLAIGKDGQNARLAAKLTGWRIDIKSATEAAEETLGRLKDRVIAPEDMDLLSLAEAILQTHEGAGLTAEERKLIDEDLEKGKQAGLSWPEEPPLVEQQLQPGTRAQEPEPVPPVVPAPASEHADRQPEVIILRPSLPADQAVEAAQLEPAELEELEEPVTSRRPIDREAELQPTFEGEPIEDSSGWVRTEPESGLYAGWEDVIETVPEFEDEWMREDLEELEEAAPAGKKAKKKKSGKSRYARSQGREGWK